MDSKDLIRAGNLSEARGQLTEEVKSAPSDVRKRTLLFQVLSFFGEWDKAEHHLGLIASQDSGAETGVQVYRNLVQAEKERKDVLGQQRPPAFLGIAPPYLESYLGALGKLHGKNVEEATRLYGEVASLRPTVTGNIDGKAFDDFRDTDTLLSLILEVIVHNRYLWVPFESLRELSVSAPTVLFDLLWAPAQVTTWEGLTASCYLPVLYPDSCRHQDDRVKLGRLTEWVPVGGPFSRGMGQHVFQAGEREIAILELRDVAFDVPVVMENA